jgi:hypothetical protein
MLSRKRKAKALKLAVIESQSTQQAATTTHISATSGSGSTVIETRPATITPPQTDPLPPPKKVKAATFEDAETDLDQSKPSASECDKPSHVRTCYHYLLSITDLLCKAASVYMKDFQSAFSKLLYYILADKSDPLIGEPCDCGAGPRTCRCKDCFSSKPTCESCFVKAHANQPTHWAEVWNGSFFDRRDISELSPGYATTLGHSRFGETCPYADYSKPIQFILVDINGVHQTKVVFCQCKESSFGRVDHLMASKIFPSTIARPESGFTFAVLQDFHLHTLTSKKSAYDYMEAICCKTDNAFPESVPVSDLTDWLRSTLNQENQDMYKNFLRVQRVWRTLTMIKRGGQAHGIDKHFPFRPKGSVVVPCFSCPEFGFNLPPNLYFPAGNSELEHLFRYVFQLNLHDY